MKITGILSISNGSGLKYPYLVVVHSLMRMCDDVIVGVDPEFPTDRKHLEELGVQIVDSHWDRSNRNGGTEIAIQMDKLVGIAKDQGSDWVVVMQADEMFHDKDFTMLRTFMERAPLSTTGFSTERLYFWKNLKTIRDDWNANLVRIFKPSAYSFLADGTSKDGMYSGQIAPGKEVELPYKIYHYSRVDLDPIIISKRIRNLDTFFHQDVELTTEDNLPAYDFKTRTHDNFSLSKQPTDVVGNLVPFIGAHPYFIEKWYEAIKEE